MKKKKPKIATTNDFIYTGYGICIIITLLSFIGFIMPKNAINLMFIIIIISISSAILRNIGFGD